MRKIEIRKVVQESYAKIAKQRGSGGGPANSSDRSIDLNKDYLKKIGYTSEELQAVPEGAIGLGCGNPVALASLREGEIVLDLGSGAGFDCFLAANKVGEKGNVIGVDMTPEMVEKARENARKGNYRNIEFRLGEIESLPVADNSIDVVISNCVINLSPDKQKTFKEAFRVLKPGGRMMVSDIVLLNELPDFIKDSIEAYTGCLSGAMLKEDFVEAIRKAGFHEVRIVDETPFPVVDCMANFSFGMLASSVISIKVYGVKKHVYNRDNYRDFAMKEMRPKMMDKNLRS